MNCPKCQAEMEKVTFAEIEVDRCTGCKGIWFDALEIEKLKKIKSSELIDIGDGDVGKEYDQIRDIECPVCHEPMVQRSDPNQPHIHFESCPVCYGAFFDAGEFKDLKQEGFFESIVHMLKQMKK